MWAGANHLSWILALPLIQPGSPEGLCTLPQLLRGQQGPPPGCQHGLGGTGQKLPARCLLHADMVPTCCALPAPASAASAISILTRWSAWTLESKGSLGFSQEKTSFVASFHFEEMNDCSLIFSLGKNKQSISCLCLQIVFSILTCQGPSPSKGHSKHWMVQRLAETYRLVFAVA